MKTAKAGPSRKSGRNTDRQTEPLSRTNQTEEAKNNPQHQKNWNHLI